MAVLDNPTFLQAIAYVIAKKAEKTKPVKAKNYTRTWVQTTMRLTLHIAGFALLTYAAFSWNITAGYALAGLSCFALSWLNSNTAQPDGSEPTDPTLRRG